MYNKVKENKGIEVQDVQAVVRFDIKGRSSVVDKVPSFGYKIEIKDVLLLVINNDIIMGEVHYIEKAEG